MMKYFAYAAAITAFLAAQFWGVPYYIESEVKRQMDAIQENEQTPEEVTILIAKMESVEGGLLLLNGTVVRVEQKVDDFSRLFTGYLERQAR